MTNMVSSNEEGNYRGGAEEGPIRIDHVLVGEERESTAAAAATEVTRDEKGHAPATSMNPTNQHEARNELIDFSPPDPEDLSSNSPNNDANKENQVNQENPKKQQLNLQ